MLHRFFRHIAIGQMMSDRIAGCSVSPITLLHAQGRYWSKVYKLCLSRHCISESTVGGALYNLICAHSDVQALMHHDPGSSVSTNIRSYLQLYSVDAGWVS